MLTIKFRANRC